MRGKKGSVTRKFAALAAMFSIIRTALFLGADDIALAAASAAAQSESTVIGILDMEFDRKNSVFSGDPAITALLSLLRSETPDEHTEPPSGETEAPAKQPEPDKTQSDVVETTITGGNGYYCSDGIYIKNETDYNIDISQMLTSPLNFTLDLGKPQVLIIHTHGSESFDPSDGLSYEESDPWRTEDPEHNVIKLGDTLAEALEAQGISVLHDRELYDYPSYAGSYGRSETAIRSYLEKL